jgi:phage-related holin
MDAVFAQVLAVLASVWSFAGVKVLVSHVALNVVLAVAAGLKAGEFTFAKLAEFLSRKLLPFVGVYYASIALGEAAGLGFIAPTVWTVITLTLAANTVENLAALGLPIPDVLLNLVKAPTPTLTIQGPPVDIHG